ncbi:MAG: recombination protein RecR [Saprospiraceae bacterium]|nr:recombination protein RecR [Saprospiraceae bacterium]MBK6564864.1 recombination protein RecR [Saprospiraceae bacterium]MBK6783011.1 recombination protein RecR [Saprospiraceae bacterium]MBK7523507.1 recombination protein RecR [Saprospiraceae bacterium]MBK8079616.1 recombination protein RecR [Saprospiraceae bacterium]
MQFSSKILEDAVMALSGLPGIGKKTALRLALHLSADKHQKSLKIAEALTVLHNDIKTCKKCFNLSDTEVCGICQNDSRRHKIICVVESARDVMAIEETNQFNGMYHVLGGVISPLEGIGPNDLNIDALISRIQTKEIDEIIMAISPTIEGETTIYYISKLLKEAPVKVSVIARGISFGGELEYADELTLGRSIMARLPYHAEI